MRITGKVVPLQKAMSRSYEGASGLEVSGDANAGLESPEFGIRIASKLSG